MVPLLQLRPSFSHHPRRATTRANQATTQVCKCLPAVWLCFGVVQVLLWEMGGTEEPR